MRFWNRISTVVLVTLVVSELMAAATCQVFAVWTFNVNPATRSVPPGGTVYFSVETTGEIPGNPAVHLSSPFIDGFNVWFTKNDLSVPFTVIMYVQVSPSKAPGSYIVKVYVETPTAIDNRAVTVVVSPTATTTAPGAGFDFSLMLSPATQVVEQGRTATYQIILTYSSPAYSGTTITIAAVTGLGPGMTYQVIPNPPSLNILTSQSTPPGSYPITITGSAMGVVRQGNAILVVQPAEQPFDFSVSASPTQQTATPGASATYTITVKLVSGTSQNVVLTVSGAPSGISPTLNPTSGTPTFNSILTLSVASSVAPGQYQMTITGAAGSKTQSTTITLTVGKPPDFRVDVNPPSQTLTQGQTASFSVSVVGLDGFSSQVSLTATGLPAGVSGVFSLPSSKSPYSSTLTIAIPSNSPIGSFTVVITGSGEGITRVANIILTINQTQTPVPGGILEMFQQNSMIIIAALALLVVLFGALAMRRRGQQIVTKQVGTSRIFCGKCGAENPASDEFCMSCGRKLKNS